LRLCVLARDPDAPAGDLRTAWAALLDGGWLHAAPSHAADAAAAVAGSRPLVAGGFARATLQVSEGVRFLANGTGGFHTRCPACGGALAAVFARALTAWRAGGPRRVACPCGHEGDLDAVSFAPTAGFATAWLALDDVGSAELLPDAAATLGQVLGGVRIVGQRG
jgi:hypothetical protein